MRLLCLRCNTCQQHRHEPTTAHMATHACLFAIPARRKGLGIEISDQAQMQCYRHMCGIVVAGHMTFGRVVLF